MRNLISDGAPSDHELQRMFSFSQSRKPSLGAEGVAAMMGTDACSCQLRVSPMSLANTYVPCLLGRPAETIACAVAASDEDEPLLCRRRANGGVDGQRLLPVLESERILDGGGGLGCSSLDRRRGHRGRRGDDRGHRRGRLVEEALDLVEERDLLLGESERRQGKDSGRRETHCGCECGVEVWREQELCVWLLPSGSCMTFSGGKRPL